MTRSIPLCFDCRYLDMRVERGRSRHWCALKKRKLDEERLLRRGCADFKSGPPYYEVPWP